MVLVGVPPAGAGVVLAGDIGTVRQILVAGVVARIDDADLARRCVGAGELVGLHHLDAVRHELTRGIRRGRRRRRGVHVALRVVLDVFDVRIARQAGQRRGRHLDRHRVHAVDLVLEGAVSGGDRAADRAQGPGLEGHDHAGGVGRGLRKRRGQSRERGSDHDGRNVRLHVRHPWLSEAGSLRTAQGFVARPEGAIVSTVSTGESPAPETRCRSIGTALTFGCPPMDDRSRRARPSAFEAAAVLSDRRCRTRD